MEPAKKIDIDELLGIVRLPQEWKFSEDKRYANTTKVEAEKFFSDKVWEKKILYPSSSSLPSPDLTLRV